MSNDPNKSNFDPIPVGSTPRPELPKVPDLPAPKAAAPVKPPVEPAPAPAASAPTASALGASPVSASLWGYLEPTRTKGVIAAGIVSLLGGAAAMNAIWPARKAAPVAQTEPEKPAPLPAPGSTSTPDKPPEFTKVEPVTLTPIVPATGAPTTIALPSIELPPLANTPTVTATPAPSPAPNVPLPELIRTGASDGTTPAAKPAEKPIAITLPDLVPSGAATPPVPSTISVPALSAPPAAAPVPTASPAPPALTLPEVKVDPPGTAPKLDLPKEIKIEPPALTAVPVPGATAAPPKLPELGVSAPTTLPAVTLPATTDPAVAPPKLESTSPLPDVKPTLTPTIASTNASTNASTSAPPPGLPGAVALPTTSKPQTDYDVDLHYVKAGDSWAGISKLHFGDERYADALRGYNGNASLAQLPRAEVPPIHVLRKNFAALIGRPVEKGTEWGAITPSSATAPPDTKRSITGNGYKVYLVPAGGRTLKEIAAAAYGDEGRWGMVWDTNPKLVPDKTVPEGTKIYLTSQSRIGD